MKMLISSIKTVNPFHYQPFRRQNCLIAKCYRIDSESVYRRVDAVSYPASENVHHLYTTAVFTCSVSLVPYIILMMMWSPCVSVSTNVTSDAADVDRAGESCRPGSPGRGRHGGPGLR